MGAETPDPKALIQQELVTYLVNGALDAEMGAGTDGSYQERDNRLHELDPIPAYLAMQEQLLKDPLALVSENSSDDFLAVCTRVTR